MHNPSCNQVSWKGGLFSNNTAADGGALYLTEVTTRSINGSAVYEFNTVRSGPIQGMGAFQISQCCCSRTPGCVQTNQAAWMHAVARRIT